MLYKKHEQKHRHPFCKLAVCAMTAIGVCAVVSATKEKMMQMADMAKGMLCRKKKSTSCEGAVHRCPVCGEPTEKA